MILWLVVLAAVFVVFTSLLLWVIRDYYNTRDRFVSTTTGRFPESPRKWPT